MLGIQTPVSWWMLYAIDFAASIGEPPPTDIKTSALLSCTTFTACRMSAIGLEFELKSILIRNSTETNLTYECWPILLNVPM